MCVCVCGGGGGGGEDNTTSQFLAVHIIVLLEGSGQLHRHNKSAEVLSKSSPAQQRSKQ